MSPGPCVVVCPYVETHGGERHRGSTKMPPYLVSQGRYDLAGRRESRCDSPSASSPPSGGERWRILKEREGFRIFDNVTGNVALKNKLAPALRLGGRPKKHLGIIVQSAKP